MRILNAALIGILSALICIPHPAARADRPEYPQTRTEAVIDVVHGISIEDRYRWLENGEDPEVQAWTNAQNELTRRGLDQFPEVKASLTGRLTSLYSIPEITSPCVFGQRYFYTRRSGLENHAIVYMREGGFEATPRAVLNPNKFSKSGAIAMDWWRPSPDGTLIAYGRSIGGSEKSTLSVRDTTTGEDLPDSIPYTRSCSIAWAPDGGGFYYTRFPEPDAVPAGDENYYRHVYYHELGADWREDPKVFGEGRPKEEWPSVAMSGDQKYLLLTVGRGWSESDLYIRRMDETEFRPVAVGLKALFKADVVDDKLYILTNHEAPRYRIVVVNPNDPSPENWKVVVPEQQGVLKKMRIVGGKLAVNILENAYSRLCVYDADGNLSVEIELPALGSVSGVNGRCDANELFFRFESFTYSPAIFRYDLGAHQMTVVERASAEHETTPYQTSQIWFNSRDGERVPMFVIHKQELVLNGDNPAVINGYGGFNINITPKFLQHPAPFLDAGGVYVLVNLRGGGEFGEQWHEAGQFERKQNVFDDMIAAAEKLIADKYTRPGRLGVRGGSNGGLLVGAVITQRPDLFNAAYCAVPLLDMVRYHRFKIARLWIPEYGSAENAAQFKYLHAYSPYHRVKPGVDYPAVLFTTAINDSRVDPMHARKMTALMQACSSSDKPILLQVEQDAGHGQGKPLHMKIAEYVDCWTFFMWRLEMLDDLRAQPTSRIAAPPTSSQETTGNQVP